jgi:N-acetylglutamate synthase-like GNAT family acetyltransferase
MAKMAIEAPLPKDETWIRQLLILCELPQEDITLEHLRHFLVLKEKGQVIGLVGVEVLGQFGLLRSLVVDPKYRCGGFASQLIEKAKEYAASLKIEALYLLTMTAEGFFAKRGYQRVERNSAPSLFVGRLNSRISVPPMPYAWLSI